MEHTSLLKLFEQNKQELQDSLIGLSLPEDAEKVQTLVINYLNGLMDSEGDFRQNLTQSEDYVLQAAMSLMNAQQAMVSEITAASTVYKTTESDSKEVHKFNTKQTSYLSKELFPYAIGATAIGGGVGGLVLGTWGAFLGSIAGTALVLYYATTKQEKPIQEDAQTKKTLELQTQKLDEQKFISIISNICASVDTLIDTFRSQIQRVVDKYENQEKPVLEREYGVLLDSIQSLLGACYQPVDEKRQKRIDSRVDQLAESLENYSLEVVKYNDVNKQYFDETASENVEQPTMILPAIIKNGQCVRKGKVFIKA